MKILITGATGGLGRELCAKLSSQNVHTVIGLGRNLEIGKVLQSQGVHFEPCGLADREKLAKVMNGVSIVVHSAALSSPWGNWNDFFEANVRGTQNVVNAALACGVQRFVQVSTPSVYYSGKPAENISEDSPLPQQRTHYARSKLAAENIVLTAFREKNLPAIILRPRGILGPHDTAIIPRIARLMKRGWFPLPGSGKALVDVTAVENVCHAIELAMHAQNSALGRIYNVSNGEPQSIEWILTKIAAEMGFTCKLVRTPLFLMQKSASVAEFLAKVFHLAEPSITRYSVDLLGLTQTLSISRIQNELGYVPQMSLAHAIKNYAHYWRVNYGFRL
jgi:nucleoside-diphosphate-sugar epimerase